MTQAPHAVVMIRPAAFDFNVETATSNAFQQSAETKSPAEINQLAQAEFDGYVTTLRANSIRVVVFEDTDLPVKPDAIFLNNWISTHADGRVILYPMSTPNRRIERRMDLLDRIREEGFAISEVIDWSAMEEENIFLEGTGSVLFDHVNRVAYANISPRTNNKAFEILCELLGYQNMAFDAVDLLGNVIYHTNVMMHIGAGYCMYCPDAISDTFQHAILKQKLTSSGLELIPISYPQMNAFAGNMLEVLNADKKRFLILSSTAYQSLTESQLVQLEKYATLLPVSIPTIEHIGGGSARCMLAGIHLPIQS